MSATNRTTNYNLPQFIGTDIPTWLGDVNGAMASIDTAIKAAKDAGDQGQADAEDVASDLAQTNAQLAAANLNITNLQGSVSNNTAAIAAQTALNGSETLNTTSQTLKGAINEVLANETIVSGASAFTSNYVNFNAADTSIIIDSVGRVTCVELIMVTTADLPKNADWASGLPAPADHNVEVLAWTSAATPLVIPMQIASRGTLYNRNTTVPAGTTVRLTASYINAG